MFQIKPIGIMNTVAIQSKSRMRYQFQSVRIAAITINTLCKHLLFCESIFTRYITRSRLATDLIRLRWHIYLDFWNLSIPILKEVKFVRFFGLALNFELKFWDDIYLILFIYHHASGGLVKLMPKAFSTSQPWAMQRK